MSFYYRKLASNIPDSKTLKQLLSGFKDLGLVKLVMDRGFYSKDNTNFSCKKRIKYLIGAKMSLCYVQDELESIDVFTFITITISRKLLKMKIVFDRKLLLMR